VPLIEVIFEVEPNYDGWRLDRYLQQKIPRLSRARIQRLIHHKLKPGPKTLKPATHVRPGLRVVLLKDVDDEPDPTHDRPVRIVHDDPALLIVDKPAGMAVHPSARYHKHTVTEWMAEHTPNPDGTRPDLAHRIDRETSGLLACARTKDATRALKKSFVGRDVEKAYLALAFGRVGPDAFTVDAPLRLTEDVKVIMEVAEGGLPSLTGFRVRRRGTLDDGRALTLVECFPHTGRQHQIRVHLAHLGHPLLGDKIYGGPTERFLRFANGTATDQDRADVVLGRHALHAWKLALPHPVTGRRAAFESPLAPDLQAFCDAHVRWDEGPDFTAREPDPRHFFERLDAAIAARTRLCFELADGTPLVDVPLQRIAQGGEDHVLLERAGLLKLLRIVTIGRG